MLRPFNVVTCPSLSKTSLGALDSLQRLVVQGQEMGHVKAGDSREIAVVIWSLLHGLSTIWAGHKMPATVIDQRRPQEMTHIFVQHLYAGLRGEG